MICSIALAVGATNSSVIVPVAWLVIVATQLCGVSVATAVAARGVKVWWTTVSVVNVKLFATGFAWLVGKTTMWEKMLSLLTQTWAEAMGCP